MLEFQKIQLLFIEFKITEFNVFHLTLQYFYLKMTKFATTKLYVLGLKINQFIININMFLYVSGKFQLYLY